MADENTNVRDLPPYMTVFEFTNPVSGEVTPYTVKDAKARERLSTLEGTVLYKKGSGEKQDDVDTSQLVSYSYEDVTNEGEDKETTVHGMLDDLSKAVLYHEPKLPTVSLRLTTGLNSFTGRKWYVGELIPSIDLTYTASVLDNNPGRYRLNNSGEKIPYGILNVTSTPTDILTSADEENLLAGDGSSYELTKKQSTGNHIVSAADITAGKVVLGSPYSLTVSIPEEVNPNTNATVPNPNSVTTDETPAINITDIYYPYYHAVMDEPITNLSDWFDSLPGSSIKNLDTVDIFKKEYNTLSDVGSRSGNPNVNEVTFNGTSANPKYFLYLTPNTVTEIADEKSGLVTSGAWKNIGTYEQVYAADSTSGVTYSTRIVFNVWITEESYVDEWKFSFNA